MPRGDVEASIWLTHNVYDTYWGKLRIVNKLSQSITVVQLVTIDDPNEAIDHKFLWVKADKPSGMMVEHEKNLYTMSRRRVVYEFFDCSTDNIPSGLSVYNP